MERRSSEHYFEEYLADCELRQEEHSLETTRSCVRIFAEFIEEHGVHVLDVDKRVMREYLTYLDKDRAVVMSTKKTHFSVVSGLYRYIMYEHEGLVPLNPVLPVRQRYLRNHKSGQTWDAQEFQIVSSEEMMRLLRTTINPRDRAVMALLAKTGIRRGELVAIDVDDIDWAKQSITLKRKRKRSNRTVYFDHECGNALRRWLKWRQPIDDEETALFINEQGTRLGRNGIEGIVNRCAARVGLHDPKSRLKKDRFSPHCFRHWFTTVLLDAGMPREYVQELRGDTHRGAIDIYYHINPESLRMSYLNHMPVLGI